MRHYCPLLVLALLCLSFSASFANEIAPLHDQQGRLLACTAKQMDSEGKTLTIGYESENSLYLDATIPKAAFKPGARYDLTLKLESGFNRRIRARALTSETLRLPVQVPGFADELQRSTRLVLAANRNEIPFVLPPLGPVFTGLRSCARSPKPPVKQAIEQTQPLKQASTPSTPLDPIKIPKAPTVQSQTVSSSLPEPLREILARAGFTSIVPLSMDDIPSGQRPADYIWRVGSSVLAGVKQRDVPDAMDMTRLAGLHIQGLKTKCKGIFTAKVGRGTQKGSLSLRKAEARCAPEQNQSGDAVSVALLMLLSKEEGLTVYTHEAPDPFKDDAFAARDQLARLWE